MTDGVIVMADWQEAMRRARAEAAAQEAASRDAEEHRRQAEREDQRRRDQLATAIDPLIIEFRDAWLAHGMPDSELCDVRFGDRRLFHRRGKRRPVSSAKMAVTEIWSADDPFGTTTDSHKGEDTFEIGLSLVLLEHLGPAFTAHHPAKTYDCIAHPIDWNRVGGTWRLVDQRSPGAVVAGLAKWCVERGLDFGL